MGVSVVRTLALAGALLASSVTRGGPPEAAPAPRQLDRYGDPLPRGAVARLGTTRLRHPGLTNWVFLPDGKTIVTAGRDGLVRYWDIATGRQLRATPGGPDWSASALSPDGRLVAGNDDEGVFVRDVASGRLLKSFPRLFPDELRFAPDGSALLMDGRKALDLASGRALEFLDSESDRAFFSPDGKRIVTAGSNWVPVWVFDRATGRQIYRVGGDTDVAAVSPDGKRMTVIGEAPGKKVMSDGDYCLRVFDFPTGKELARFKL
ncbi:MAG TPA: hypothetical protein VFG68_00735, partial [Fimbriiglobus sp.]|nr:hypothetical protein [Fimbriiglobus sp.]